MGQKRKRRVKNRAPTTTPQSCLSSTTGRFRAKESHTDQNEHPHPIISLYYRQVLTLRQYLLQQLPLTSKTRRRRILSLKTPVAPRIAVDKSDGGHGQHEDPVRIIANLLDTTLIGVPKEPPLTGDRIYRQDFVTFTQSQDRSQCTDTGAPCPQSEVISSLPVYLNPFLQSGDVHSAKYTLTRTRTDKSITLSKVRGFKTDHPTDCGLCHISTV